LIASSVRQPAEKDVKNGPNLSLVNQLFHPSPTSAV
jgi:hypothetical protein